GFQHSVLMMNRRARCPHTVGHLTGYHSCMSEDCSDLRVGTIIDISLVDVPGIPVTVIFTGGCNFDCPYCQNASLIPNDSGEEMTPSEIVAQVKDFLSDGFCITGGEPTIHRDLPSLLKVLREEVGGHINLNTQGSVPSILKQSLPYLDSIWLDLKTSPTRYREISRTSANPWPRIQESINMILASDVALWPRTTYVGDLMQPSDIAELLVFLQSTDYQGEYLIQNFVSSTGVREEEKTSLREPDMHELHEVLSHVPDTIDLRLDWR
ncbi:MAG: radical SAM protein, partial [Candidatus Thorarchaeota archaeon]|nr:radical SAM protein [Candidatus Thorarchaeota archaeon]